MRKIFKHGWLLLFTLATVYTACGNQASKDGDSMAYQGNLNFSEGQKTKTLAHQANPGPMLNSPHETGRMRP